MAPNGFAIVSLQGFHQHLKEPKEPGGPLRFGFGWLTNFHSEESIGIHHQALLDLIRALSGEGIADTRRVFLLGFSQSCALNYRFAFTYPEILRGVIGMCGGLPGDLESSELYRSTEASVFHLSGTRDEFYTPDRVADYKQRLRRYARDVVVKSYEAGHELCSDNAGRCSRVATEVFEWVDNSAIACTLVPCSSSSLFPPTVSSHHSRNNPKSKKRLPD